MVTLLGLITIALVIIILFQLSQAGDLASSLRGREATYKITNKVNGALFLVFLFVGMISAFYSAWALSDRFLPAASSVHGGWIEQMFFWTLVATVPIFVTTHVLLFFFAFKYKRQEGKKSFYFPESNKLELLWTVIPSIVLIILVYEGMRNWYKIMSPAPENALVVEATAQQFFWTLRYSGQDNQLGNKRISLINSDNPLGQIWSDDANKDDFTSTDMHLPVGRPVLVRINALDVIHGFNLPHFKVKMDAVPGIPTQFWFTPTKTTEQMREELNDPDFNYELACTEMCGVSHYNMRRVVIVETEEQFNAWQKEQTPIYVANNVQASLENEVRK